MSRFSPSGLDTFFTDANQPPYVRFDHPASTDRIRPPRTIAIVGCGPISVAAASLLSAGDCFGGASPRSLLIDPLHGSERSRSGLAAESLIRSGHDPKRTALECFDFCPALDPDRFAEVIRDADLMIVGDVRPEAWRVAGYLARLRELPTVMLTQTDDALAINFEGLRHDTCYQCARSQIHQKLSVSKSNDSDTSAERSRGDGVGGMDGDDMNAADNAEGISSIDLHRAAAAVVAACCEAVRGGPVADVRESIRLRHSLHGQSTSAVRSSSGYVMPFRVPPPSSVAGLAEWFASETMRFDPSPQCRNCRHASSRQVERTDRTAL